MKRKYLSLAVAVLAGLALSMFSGCGGGSSASSGGSNGGGSSTPGICGQQTKTYLAYTKKYNNSEKGVYFVDPDDPTSPIEITPNSIIGSAPVGDYNYNASTGELNDIHPKFLLYIDANDSNSLKKISLEKNNNTLSPETLDTGLDCGAFGQVLMTVNPKKWVDIYLKPDDTAGCPSRADDRTKGDLYIVGTDFQNPVKIGKRNIVTVLYPGEVERYLVAEGTGKWAMDGLGEPQDDNYTLYSCPLDDLLNCDEIMSNVVSYHEAGVKVEGKKGIPYLCIKTSSGQSLYKFIKDNSGSYIAQNLNVSCDVNWAYDYDENAIYALASGTPSLSTTLKKYEFNSSANQFQDLDYNITNTSLYGRQGEDYFILNKVDISSNELKLVAVNKNDGSEIVLDNIALPYSAVGPTFPYLDRFTKRILWVKAVDTDSDGKVDGVKACSWKEGESNTSIVCSPNSYWSAMVYYPNQMFKFGVQAFDVMKPCRALLVKNIDSNLSGGTIYAVDLADMSETLIGDIPSKYSGVIGLGIGNDLLLRAGESNITGPADIFYLDLDKKKVEQVTDTPDDEAILTE